MNELKRLVAEHCPNGVEYVALGEVCKIYKGQQLNKEFLKKSEITPLIMAGLIIRDLPKAP